MALDIVAKLNHIIWDDALERRGLLGRVTSTVMRYLYAVLRDLFTGQLTMRAMSLVYTTLLSTVPLLAFSFSVVKGLGVHKQLEEQIYLLVEPLGEEGTWLVDNMLRFVDNVNGGVLGGLGLAFFIYTAIAMVMKVEESFNYVWYVSQPRSFARRFTEYVFVLLIGPVIVAIALGTLTALQNEAAVQWLVNNDVVGPLFVATGKLTPYLLLGGLFTFLYKFMPNTRVNITSALVGGLAGGFLWATVGAIFAAFVLSSAQTQTVYASFAIAVFSLIWVYLNWMILLIGAQLAFYYQNPTYLRDGRREPRLSNSMRERMALNIMFLVGDAFRDTEHPVITIRSLSRQLGVPSLTLNPLINGLESRGLLKLNEKEELMPGRDTTTILLDEIVDVVRTDGETGAHTEPRWSAEIDGIGKQLDSAVKDRIRGRTLADLLRR